MTHRIFISLRFAEAELEATALKIALEDKGISTFLCSVQPGGDIAREIISALDGCKLAIIMGTRTYGKDTGNGFSTFEELRFIKKEKPYFLVKMCEMFEEPETRFRLDDSISYYQWYPGSPIPSDLISKILQKLESTIDPNNSFGSNENFSFNSLSRPAIHNTIPLEGLSPTESIELLFFLGCSTELRKRVKELNLVIDGGYLTYLREVEILRELDGNKTNLRIPNLLAILAKLKKFQENGIPSAVLDAVYQQIEDERIKNEKHTGVWLTSSPECHQRFGGSASLELLWQLR
eukprot:gene12443-16689_t